MHMFCNYRAIPKILEFTESLKETNLSTVKNNKFEFTFETKILYVVKMLSYMLIKHVY